MGIFDKLFKTNKLQYEIVRDENGKHQIGGDIPKDFIIPENEFIAGFQYLGFIDNTDPIFSWLPFKVNLIHPIYTDEYSVFLDYTNPNKPTIIEPTDTASSTSAFDEIDKNSKIIMLYSAGTSNKLMEALKLGAMDFIQKPYTGEQIAKALDTIRKEVI